MPIDHAALTHAACRDCGVSFAFDAEFYAVRALAPPTRCRHCRQARRAQHPPPLVVAGVVAAVGAHFAFLAETASGRQFFAHRSNITPDTWPLAVGEAVSFEPAQDGRDYETPGRCPRAYRVQRL